MTVTSKRHRTMPLLSIGFFLEMTYNTPINLEHALWDPMYNKEHSTFLIVGLLHACESKNSILL